MAKPIVNDQLWKFIKPIFPKHQPRPKGGRPPVDDRKALTEIVIVLKTGIPWQYLPKEMGCGSGMTCWRRLGDWQKAGIWDKIHHILLSHLREKDKIDFSREVVDSASVRAVFGGGVKTGPNATDRRKLGSKHHIITDANGIPFAAKVTEIVSLVVEIHHMVGAVS